MSRTMKLGDEAPVSDTDPRMLRVVALRISDTDGECEYCALRRGALAVCANGHPLDCVNMPRALHYRNACAVFVDDIPVLAVKGILA